MCLALASGIEARSARLCRVRADEGFIACPQETVCSLGFLFEKLDDSTKLSVDLLEHSPDSVEKLDHVRERRLALTPHIRIVVVGRPGRKMTDRD